MSQDGKNWARLEADHHTAAVIDAGDEGDWDEAFIGSPQVQPKFICKLATSLCALILNLSMPKHVTGRCHLVCGCTLQTETSLKPTVRLSLLCMKLGLQAESRYRQFSS